jgi:hypothetical protein
LFRAAISKSNAQAETNSEGWVVFVWREGGGMLVACLVGQGWWRAEFILGPWERGRGARGSVMLMV